MANTNAEDGLPVTLSLNTYTKTGYTFIGWNTNPFAPTALYLDGATIPALTAGMDLYAIWMLTPYTITYELYGGTNNSSNPTGYTYGHSFIFFNPLWLGYFFGGWFAESTFTTPVTAINPTDASNLHLYAKWSAEIQTISYHSNGGAGSMTDTTANTDASVTLTGNTFTKPGYNFNGWNTQADGLGTSYANGATFTMPAGGLQLYAQWVPVPLDDVISGMTITQEPDGTIVATFPAVSEDVAALDYKINTNITVGALPAGTLVSVSMNSGAPVTRNLNDLTDLDSNPDTRTFSFTDFFGVSAADFTRTRYNNATETYDITISGNLAPVNTTMTLKCFLFKTGAYVTLEEQPFS
jgi:uncharacterized repeat protein (TIGR02543 family)